eukprot:XP_014774630.1 PREDICTED: uncharacterized protein LOC106872233 [Octopus bimaculoides]
MNRKKFTLGLLESPEDVIRLRWNLHPCTLLETLSQVELPFIVQAENSSKWPYAEQCFDWAQPLLMYQQISGVKVYAQMIDQSNGVPETVDQVTFRNPQLFVIPIECQGWFELLDRRLEEGDRVGSNSYLDTSSQWEGSAGNWNTLAKVIAAMPVRFLSLFPLKVFVLVSETDEDSCYEKTTLPPYSELQFSSVIKNGSLLVFTRLNVELKLFFNLALLYKANVQVLAKSGVNQEKKSNWCQSYGEISKEFEVKNDVDASDEYTIRF